MYFVLLHSWTDSRSLLHSVPCATSCGPTRSKTSATSEPQNTTLTIVSEVAHIFLGIHRPILDDFIAVVVVKM